ncbi:NAD-dependent epimerase/dehydratase family protein [Loigolactobacillus binensis]|uniref:NAD-dependent epimerase/dehydratase family protein n=1 Tax=Loigolactobacillus binensis TaxID=2559922 RepID=A0ABW3EAN5_9LACO|nr:NAD-dependent epimerase/dehydratase family protein [Loigolactobacillus binensis]
MNIILLGGNGYIGRNVTQQLLQQTSDAVLYVLSRSGKNQLQDPRIKNIAVDLSDVTAIQKHLPAEVDYIIDFIGRPAKTQAELVQANQVPAELMLTLAEQYQVRAMGFIGGILGPKPFVQMKAKLIQYLQNSRIPLVYVEPTLVYGNGRSDSMAKMVPLLKFLGLFAKGLKPVHVDAVANELVTKLLEK